MNIYVGNLSGHAVDDDLRRAFEVFGQVASVNLIMNKSTGVSRGFGFVQMPVETEARAAIDGLNGEELKGRLLTVNEARPRPEGSYQGRAKH